MITQKLKEYENITQNIQEKTKNHKIKIIDDFFALQKSLEIFIKNQDKNFSSLSQKENYFYFLQEIENIKKEFEELKNIQKNLQEYTKKFQEKDFRVVIFWKTNVWKSTLREALTMWEWKSIGIWKQWTTVDYHEYTWWPLQIVDVPWIWESDGSGDLWTKHAQIALKQAQYADLLLFLISDDTSWIDYIIDYIKNNLVQLWKKIIFVINYQKEISFDLLDKYWLEKYLKIEFDENTIDEVRNFYTQRFQEKWLYFDYDFEIINAEAGFLAVTQNKNYRFDAYQSRFLEKRKELAKISNLDKLEEKILNEFIEYWEQIRISWYYQFYVKQLEKTSEIIQNLYQSFLQRKWYLEVELQKFEKFFTSWEKWIFWEIKEIVESKFDDLFKEVEDMIQAWKSKEEIEKYLKSYISKSGLKESLDESFSKYQISLTKEIHTINKNFQQKATFIDENIFGNIKLSQWININWDFLYNFLSIWIKSVWTLWWTALWAKLWSALWSKWAIIWWIVWGLIGAFLSSEISDWIKDDSKTKQIENKKILKQEFQKQATEIIQKIQTEISKNTEIVKKEIFSKFQKYFDILEGIISTSENKAYKMKLKMSKDTNLINYNHLTKDLYIEFYQFSLFKNQFYDILSNIFWERFTDVEKYLYYFINNSILWIYQNINTKIFSINTSLFNYLLIRFDTKTIHFIEKENSIHLYLLWKNNPDIERYINKFFSKNIICKFYKKVDENILEYKNKKYVYIKENNFLYPTWFDKIEKRENYFIVYEKESFNFVLHNWLLVSNKNILQNNNTYFIAQNNGISSIIDKDKNIINTHCIAVNDNLYFNLLQKKYISLKNNEIQYFTFESLENIWDYFIVKEKEKYFILNKKFDFIWDEFFDKIQVINEKYLQVSKNKKINFLETKNFEYVFNHSFDTVKKVNNYYLQVDKNGVINFLDIETLKFKFKDWFSAFWIMKKDFYWVKIWNNYNILNKNYDLIFEENFDSIFSFWEKYFVVKIWNKSNILDENMNLFFHENIEYIGKIKNNWYAKIQKNWKTNFLNSKDLTYKYDFWFQSIWDFWENYYKAEQWYKDIYILDKNYDILDIFQYIGRIEQNWYAKVEQNGKVNFLNPQNLTYKYDAWFDTIWSFWENYYKAEKWKLFYFLDKNYDIIKNKSWYIEIWRLNYENKALIKDKSGNYNIIDNNINNLYDTSELLWSKSSYFAIVSKNWKYNFIDYDYNEIFNWFVFDENNCAILKDKNWYFLIDDVWKRNYNWYFESIKMLNDKSYEVKIWEIKYYLYLDWRLEEKTFFRSLLKFFE